MPPIRAIRCPRQENKSNVTHGFYQCEGDVYMYIIKQTKGVDSIFVQCWASVVDAGTTLNKH